MQPDELFDTEMMSNHFFYPLVNMSTDIGNTEILDFIRMHTLEYAPVSDAARNHIEKLKAMGMKPEEWRDFYSRPVLQVAVAYNYLALAKWLVEEGVVLQNDMCVSLTIDHPSLPLTPSVTRMAFMHCCRSHSFVSCHLFLAYVFSNTGSSTLKSS